MRWQEQLESILAEDVAGARDRERQAFDQIAGPRAQSVVLYGAGNLGRKVLRGLRQHNLEPMAFADTNPALDGKHVEGIPVFSPEEAVRRFGKEAVFVVCVWHPDREHGVQEIVNHLCALGVERVTSFVPLFWKFAETFLPYYLWDLPSKLLQAPAAIRQACFLLEEESRSQFTAQLCFRSQAAFSCLPAPSPEPVYFSRELFELRRDECFIDCGAFNGDTIRDFLRVTGGEFQRIVAFEPDPLNFEALQLSVGSDRSTRDRMILHHAAVGGSVGKVRVGATGQPNAVVGDGDIEVTCETIDHALKSETPTLIKMDIEGLEVEALAGGTETVRRSQPLMAICAYHQQDHLWSIPLQLHDLQPDSHLSLRMYWQDGFDLVCFSVPPNRHCQRL